MPEKISSDKIFIRDVFTWWFRVPDYQRPYVWGTDQVSDLLDDIYEWQKIRHDSEYFLGSIVLQEQNDRDIPEYDLLDGQQRLSTCLLIHAVGRDMADNPQLRDSCKKTVFQEENRFDNIPERIRIVYDIRKEVQEFIDEFIKTDQGTNNVDGLKQQLESPDLSVRNLANAVLIIREFFEELSASELNDFFTFFRNKVLMVYVSSANLDDAFRMFTVLNDRGMKLRGSDILKTLNLRKLREDGANDIERGKWAQMWEEIEGDLDDDFDVFLSHLRSVLVKDKARLSLLQEFEDNIYAPKVFDRTTRTYQDQPPLLQPGRDTFRFVERYYGHYQKIFSSANYDINNDSYRFDNMITLMNEVGLADFWVPPLLRYYDVFQTERIIDFVYKLESKFCGDWITYKTPTDRISAMNKITDMIDQVTEDGTLGKQAKIDRLLNSDVFDYDKKMYRDSLENQGIYGRRFVRYLLFKLDVLFASSETRLQVPKWLSVEHILPQNPKDNSEWVKKFGEEEREIWTHRIGNLVLLSRRKNSTLGRREFKEKKEQYFKNNIELFPNSVRILALDDWDLEKLKENHKKVIDMLCRA